MIIIPFMLLLIFIFGAIIGSFLNVIILRMNTGKGISGRSMCFSCGKQLTAFELVPILSFFIQGGKCRGCKHRISWQYPLIEFLTGTMFVLVFWKIQTLFIFNPATWILIFAYYGIIFSTLIVISVYDMRHKIVPDRAVFAFIGFSFLSVLFKLSFGSLVFAFSLDHLIAGIILALPFAALWYFSKGRWIGFGDAKLALGIGFLLGISSGIAAIMISFWIGAIAGLIVLLLQRAKFTMKSEIPFAPFLGVGTAIAFLASITVATLSLVFTF